MIKDSERINIGRLVVEMPERENNFDQRDLIDERHWRWLEDKLKQPFAGTRKNHTVLDVAANFKVLFPQKFSKITPPNVDMQKVDFSLFSNPRSFILLFPGLTFLANSTEDSKEFLKKVQQCREEASWPQYFKLASLYRLVNPSYKTEPFTDDELKDVDDNLPQGTSLFEIFEDAKLACSETLDSFIDYVDSLGAKDTIPNDENFKRWIDIKKEKLEEFGNEVFERADDMFDFTELIRQISVIEADEVIVSEKGIELVYKTSLDEDKTPALPEQRRY